MLLMLMIMILMMKGRERGKLTLREDALGINEVVKKKGRNAQGPLKCTMRMMRRTMIDVAQGP